MDSKALRPGFGHYLPPLTGLRGVGVALVFLFHTRVPLLGGTFVGVDLFFLLSGFLITGLLLREFQHTSRISLKKFYIRRVLRLTPALLFLLACHLVAVWLLFPALLVKQLQDALIVLVNGANWSRALDFERPDMLGHAWSLSTEEQFYLLWPFCMMLLLRLRFRVRVWVIAGVILLITLWRPFLLHLDVSWERVYNDFTCRADMLLYGCLAAALQQRGCFDRLYQDCRGRLALLLRLSAVTALLLLMVTARWQEAWLYRWGYVLFAVAGAWLCVDLLNAPRSAAARLLSWKPLVQLGVISYAFYLFHYPIIDILFRLEMEGWPLYLLALGLTLLFSTVSWFFVEKPALVLKKRFTSC